MIVEQGWNPLLKATLWLTMVSIRPEFGSTTTTVPIGAERFDCRAAHRKVFPVDNVTGRRVGISGLGPWAAPDDRGSHGPLADDPGRHPATGVRRAVDLRADAVDL